MYSREERKALAIISLYTLLYRGVIGNMHNNNALYHISNVYNCSIITLEANEPFTSYYSSCVAVDY